MNASSDPVALIQTYIRPKLAGPIKWVFLLRQTCPTMDESQFREWVIQLMLGSSHGGASSRSSLSSRSSSSLPPLHTLSPGLEVDTPHIGGPYNLGPEPHQLPLKKHQQPHVDEIYKIITSNTWAVEPSGLGSGKTPCAFRLMEMLKARMLVFGPASAVEANWIKQKNTFDVLDHNLFYITWNSTLGKIDATSETNPLSPTEQTADDRSYWSNTQIPDHGLLVRKNKFIKPIPDRPDATLDERRALALAQMFEFAKKREEKKNEKKKGGTTKATSARAQDEAEDAEEEEAEEASDAHDSDDEEPKKKKRTPRNQNASNARKSKRAKGPTIPLNLFDVQVAVTETFRNLLRTGTWTTKKHVEIMDKKGKKTVQYVDTINDMIEERRNLEHAERIRMQKTQNVIVPTLYKFRFVKKGGLPELIDLSDDKDGPKMKRKKWLDTTSGKDRLDLILKRKYSGIWTWKESEFGEYFRRILPEKYRDKKNAVWDDDIKQFKTTTDNGKAIDWATDNPNVISFATMPDMPRLQLSKAKKPKKTKKVQTAAEEAQAAAESARKVLEQKSKEQGMNTLIVLEEAHDSVGAGAKEASKNRAKAVRAIITACCQHNASIPPPRYKAYVLVISATHASTTSALITITKQLSLLPFEDKYIAMVLHKKSQRLIPASIPVYPNLPFDKDDTWNIHGNKSAKTFVEYCRELIKKRNTPGSGDERKYTQLMDYYCTAFLTEKKDSSDSDSEEHIRKRMANFFCTLYTHVILPQISHAMETTVRRTEFDLAIGHYLFDDYSDYMAFALTCDMPKISVERYQRGTIPICVRLVRCVLETDPHAKVAVFFYNERTLAALKDALVASASGKLAIQKEYRAIEIISGEQSKKNKASKIIADFQDPAPTSRRILFGTIGTVSTGINLDDTTGTRPVHLFIGGLTDVKSIHQATMRIERASTKSPTFVRIVMGRLLHTLQPHNDIVAVGKKYHAELKAEREVTTGLVKAKENLDDVCKKHLQEYKDAIADVETQHAAHMKTLEYAVDDARATACTIRSLRYEVDLAIDDKARAVAKMPVNPPPLDMPPEPLDEKLKTLLLQEFKDTCSANHLPALPMHWIAACVEQGTVLHETSPQQVLNGIRFPHQYRQEREYKLTTKDKDGLRSYNGRVERYLTFDQLWGELKTHLVGSTVKITISSTFRLPPKAELADTQPYKYALAAELNDDKNIKPRMLDALDNQTEQESTWPDDYTVYSLDERFHGDGSYDLDAERESDSEENEDGVVKKRKRRASTRTRTLVDDDDDEEEEDEDDEDEDDEDDESDVQPEDNEFDPAKSEEDPDDTIVSESEEEEEEEEEEAEAEAEAEAVDASDVELLEED